jgi:hypothetical protein
MRRLLVSLALLVLCLLTAAIARPGSAGAVCSPPNCVSATGASGTITLTGPTIAFVGQTVSVTLSVTNTTLVTQISGFELAYAVADGVYGADGSFTGTCGSFTTHILDCIGLPIAAGATATMTATFTVLDTGNLPIVVTALGHVGTDPTQPLSLTVTSLPQSNFPSTGGPVMSQGAPYGGSGFHPGCAICP